MAKKKAKKAKKAKKSIKRKARVKARMKKTKAACRLFMSGTPGATV